MNQKRKTNDKNWWQTRTAFTGRMRRWVVPRRVVVGASLIDKERRNGIGMPSAGKRRVCPLGGQGGRERVTACNPPYPSHPHPVVHHKNHLHLQMTTFFHTIPTIFLLFCQFIIHDCLLIPLRCITPFINIHHFSSYLKGFKHPIPISIALSILIPLHSFSNIHFLHCIPFTLYRLLM